MLAQTEQTLEFMEEHFLKEGSVPANPHIQTKNLGYSTDQNGNFPINIKVAAQDQ